jgi:hypothetical protein
MTAQIVNERLRQVPFRPFDIETEGGTWIDIDREADVLIYDRFKPVRIVFFDSHTGRMFILEPEQISTIESK